MSIYRFDCMCEWPILEGRPHRGEIPALDFDIQKASLSCPATWALLGRGETKGLFQLESSLGRHWTKRLKPEALNHLGALGATLRPGCLKAMTDKGVSMTDLYCLRKNGHEPVEQYHPVIDSILAPTYGVLVYQEQSMAIAKEVAGFTLQEADGLRKAIGKKLASEMSKIRTMFLEGAKQAGVLTPEQAEEVFSWIQKSQRYSFNKCVAGDTIIRRPNGGRFMKEARFSVEYMYRVRNDLEFAKANGHESLRRKWKRLGNYGNGLSMGEDGRIRPNTIVDIKPAGRRQVFKITLHNGSSIRVTDNHKFPTTNGIKTTAELSTSDMLYVCGEYEEIGRTKGGEYPSISMSIVGMTPDGECDTYDVTMHAPNHTFVTGDGVVTCNSHAVCYGVVGYYCAYIKAHFPHAFYANWLTHSDDKDEVYELVQDAKLFDIEVVTPNLSSGKMGFDHDGKVVQFGISNISGVGPAACSKLQENIAIAEQELLKPLDRFDWVDFLLFMTGKGKTSRDVMLSLIRTGALKWMGTNRRLMEFEFESWIELTDTQLRWAREDRKQQTDSNRWRTVTEALKGIGRTKKEGGGCHSKPAAEKVMSQVQLLENPPTKYEDSPHWIAWAEESLLGISLSCSQLDACDLSEVNVSCRDFLAGQTGFLVFGVKVESARTFKTKNGKNPGQIMGFLTISDHSGSMENVIVFPDRWKEYGAHLTQGALVIIQGKRSDKGDSLIVERVWPAT